MVLLHVSGGGGERYGTPLYGEVSCLFSMGRDRIGPTPMLLPLSLLRYGGSWEKNAVKIISLKKFDEISKTHAPAFFIPLQPFERNGLSIFILLSDEISFYFIIFPVPRIQQKNDDRRKWESRFLPVGSLEGDRFSRMDDRTDNELFAFFLEVLVSLPT